MIVQKREWFSLSGNRVRVSKYSWKSELERNLTSKWGKREYSSIYKYILYILFKVPKIVYYYSCIRYKGENETKETDVCHMLRTWEFLLQQWEATAVAEKSQDRYWVSPVASREFGSFWEPTEKENIVPSLLPKVRLQLLRILIVGSDEEINKDQNGPFVLPYFVFLLKPFRAVILNTIYCNAPFVKEISTCSLYYLKCNSCMYCNLPVVGWIMAPQKIVIS